MNLKPCPRCHGAAAPLTCQTGVPGTMGFDMWHAVRCTACNITLGGHMGPVRYRSADDAATAWNTRK